MGQNCVHAGQGLLPRSFEQLSPGFQETEVFALPTAPHSATKPKTANQKAWPSVLDHARDRGVDKTSKLPTFSVSMRALYPSGAVSTLYTLFTSVGPFLAWMRCGDTCAARYAAWTTGNDVPAWTKKFSASRMVFCTLQPARDSKD